MYILDILNELDSVKTNDKKQILKREQDNVLFKKVFDYTYNPRITFGIKAKTMPTKQGNDSIMPLTDAFITLDALNNRDVTGHAAIKELQETLDYLHPNDAEVVRRIILKDLECGTGFKLAAAVWGSYYNYIPPQMLANPNNEANIKKYFKKSSGDHIVVEQKADGARCHLDLMILKMFSRSWNEYHGLEPFKQSFNNIGDEWRNYVVDGELLVESKTSNGESNTAIRETGNGIINKSLSGTISPSEADTVVFVVWDIIPRDEYYKRDVVKIPNKVRYNNLTKFVESIGSNKLKLIPRHEVNNMDDVRKLYQKYVSMCYEGVVMKDPESYWEDNRSNLMIKFKEKHPVELKVVGFIPHTKHDDRVGSLCLESECGTFKFNAGSGLTNKLSKKDEENPEITLNNKLIFDNIDMFMGKIIQIESNGITSRKNSEGKSLFLPIIKKWRLDKSVANNNEEIEDIFNNQ